jgi:hypothetical protein
MDFVRLNQSPYGLLHMNNDFVLELIEFLIGTVQCHAA